MGRRGPLPDPSSRRGLVRARNGTDVVPVRGRPEVLPDAPADLGVAGFAAWVEAWACEWAHVSDARSIEELARLEDERAALREAVGDELLFEKPVVSPRGDVVGIDRYANPLLRELRRLDAPLTALRDRLGLSPVARARLGQAVVQLRKDENALERQRIMDRYRKAAEQK